MRTESAGRKESVPSTRRNPIMMATAASAKVAKVSRTALERVAMRSVFMVASRKRSETAKMRPAWSRLRPKALSVSIPRSESMK